MDDSWSDLPTKPVFLPLVHQLMRYLGRYEEAPAWRTVGQVLDLTSGSILVGSRRDRVALTPAGKRVTLPTGSGPEFLELDEQGFYELRSTGAAESRPPAVAVDIDPAESDLSVMDQSEFTAAVTGHAGPQAGVDGGRRSRKHRRISSAGRRSGGICCSAAFCCSRPKQSSRIAYRGCKLFVTRTTDQEPERPRTPTAEGSEADMGDAGHRAELVEVIRQIRNRWRLKLALRGVVVVVAGSLLALLLSASGLEALRFSAPAIIAFRVIVAGGVRRAGRGLAVAAAQAPGQRRAGRALRRRVRSVARSVDSERGRSDQRGGRVRQPLARAGRAPRPAGDREMPGRRLQPHDRAGGRPASCADAGGHRRRRRPADRASDRRSCDRVCPRCSSSTAAPKRRRRIGSRSRPARPPCREAPISRSRPSWSGSRPATPRCGCAARRAARSSGCRSCRRPIRRCSTASSFTSRSRSTTRSCRTASNRRSSR